MVLLNYPFYPAKLHYLKKPTAREMKPVIIEAIREVLQEEVCTRLDKLEEKVDETYIVGSSRKDQRPGKLTGFC